MNAFALTLSDHYLSTFHRRVRDLVIVSAGALFVAALAQLKIPLPFTPVPLTGQTFAVLLVGAALGAKRGAAALGLYFIMGALGLPFYAGGASGLAYLSGPTFGFLIGFVVAAYVIGLLAERGLERHMHTSLFVFLVGEIIIYFFGVTWLAVVFGNLQKAIVTGFLPFIIGDAIKLMVATLTLPAAWKLTE